MDREKMMLELARTETEEIMCLISKPSIEVLTPIRETIYMVLFETHMDRLKELTIQEVKEYYDAVF